MPPALDLISIDAYSGYDPSVPGTEEVTRVQQLVKHMPSLHAHQQILVVPGVFGCRNTTYFPLAQQEAHVLSKLDAYLVWMNSDSRIAGMNPYHWKTRGHDEPTSPTYRNKCDLALGARDMPRVAARLREIGRSIIANGNKTGPGRATTVRLAADDEWMQSRAASRSQDHAVHKALRGTFLSPFGEWCSFNATRRDAEFAAMAALKMHVLVVTCAVVSNSAGTENRAFYPSALDWVTERTPDDCIGSLIRAAEQHGITEVHIGLQLSDGFMNASWRLDRQDGLRFLAKAGQQAIDVARELHSRFGSSPVFKGMYDSNEINDVSWSTTHHNGFNGSAWYEPWLQLYLQPLHAEVQRLGYTGSNAPYFCHDGVVAEWGPAALAEFYHRLLIRVPLQVLWVQDCVGVSTRYVPGSGTFYHTPEMVVPYYKALASRLATLRPQRELWSDTEIFEYANCTGVSNGVYENCSDVAGGIQRVRQQLELEAPFVTGSVSFSWRYLSPFRWPWSLDASAGKLYAQYSRYIGHNVARKSDDSWVLPGDKDNFVVAAGERQLFLTEHGISHLQGLQRTMHKANKKGPVIRPAVNKSTLTFQRSAPQVRSSPFWVPEEQKFRFVVVNADGANPEPARWYSSPDLVQWSFEREANSSSVKGLSLIHIVYDPTDPDPTARFKTNYPPMNDPAGVGGMAVSHTGIQWRKVAAGVGIQTSDEQQLSFDPKRKRFIYTVKRGNAHGRAVALTTTKDFYAKAWSDLGVVFGTDDLDQVIGREEIRRRLGDATMSQPMCVRSAAERNTSLVPDGPCYNATCPTVPRCTPSNKRGPCYMGPKPCWNVDIYNMVRTRVSSVVTTDSLDDALQGTFRYESVYLGIPAFYHAVGPDHPNPASPGTWNTDGARHSVGDSLLLCLTSRRAQAST